MAKTIKFNLICDGHPVRTIEELQNNFSIEDILSYFKRGLLERWLDVRGYDKEKSQVAKIDKNLDKLQQISELIKIFKVESDDKEINEGIYNLYYEERKKGDLEKYEKEDFKVKEVVNGYFDHYEKLVDEIISEPTNAALIKSNVNSIVHDYSNIFEVDYRRLFNRLLRVSHLAILYLLTHEKAREKYISFPDKDGNTSIVDYQNKYLDNINMRNTIMQIFFNASSGDYKESWKFKFNEGNAKEEFGGKIHFEKRSPSKYFSEVCSTSKKIMVICIPKETEITCEKRRVKNESPFTAKQVNGQFMLLDGLLAATADDQPIVYMEV